MYKNNFGLNTIFKGKRGEVCYCAEYVVNIPLLYRRIVTKKKVGSKNVVS
jgi:hypothetical protein